MMLVEPTDSFDDSRAAELLVICLCAEWCSTCRDYRTGFDELARQFPDVRFEWVDIEASADDLGDLDIENFPTLLVLRAELVLFYGVMLPYTAHLRRAIENFLEHSSGQRRDYAFSSPERRAWQIDEDLRRLANIPPGGFSP